MLKPVLMAALLASAGTAVAQGAPATSDVPLIERTKLFGNPFRTQGRLSPDGKWLSWIAPRDGVMNIWVAPANDPSKAKALTAETTRPIRQHFWSPDSSMVMFVNDKGGDENFLLYGVDVATGAQRLLTPFEKTRVQIENVSPLIPGSILIGVNNRDPRWHDIHSLDLKTGKLTLVQQNDGYAGFVTDQQHVVRMALRPNAAGGNDFFKVEGGKIAATPFASTGLDDSLTTSPAGYTSDGKTLYWVDSRGRDTAALIAEDVATGAKTVIAEDSRADIGSAISNPKTGKVEGYSVYYLRNEWRAVDPTIKGDLDFLKAQLKGDFSVTSRTLADDRWLVSVDPVTSPTATYLYERAGKKLTRLFVTRPELEGQPLVPMQTAEIKSRDGLTLPSYLTLPKSADPNGDGKADKPVPMVMFVHGGPWARDGYGYNSYHQWLANRGYAVLSVNFRSSTGFGKKFTSAGDRQWGRTMHDDLLDAKAWAVKQGVTTADKVAIMGGSYGGYATLAGLAFTPTEFACGVDIVGPSNLLTLLSTIPAYWEAGRRQLYQRVGDPTTPDGIAMLKERSPLNSAHNIVRPLLIGQGANDPRVKQAESDQIVDAMKAKGIPVTYVLFPDEGHGFARPVNNIAFNAVAENFLSRCLGGRAEPIGGALKASTAQVPHGAEYAPGLKDALTGK